MTTTSQTTSRRSRSVRDHRGGAAAGSQDKELAKAVDVFLQWTIGADAPGIVTSGHRYTLKNRTNRKFFQYEEQTWGINLGWTDDAEPSTAAKVRRWAFVGKGGAKAPMTYGQPVALAWGDRFVRYGARDVGINLDWSKAPVFEWQLLGGAPGAPVRTGEWLSLFNTRSEGGEPLLHFDRTVGGNIGWPSSKTWGAQLKEMGTDLAKDAILDYLKGKRS